jgi:hypothetical protein
MMFICMYNHMNKCMSERKGKIMKIGRVEAVQSKCKAFREIHNQRVQRYSIYKKAIKYSACYGQIVTGTSGY